MIKTSADLLQSIKRGVSMPENQKRFTDQDLLEFADEEIESKILPVISAMRQEFLVYRETQALVANQASYPIPYRAMGRVVKDVVLVQGTTTRRQLPLISPSEAYGYSATGTPAAFYLENDSVVLVPTPTSVTHSLELKYVMRPSRLIALTDCRQITGISANTLTFASTPPSTFSTNNPVDLIQGRQGNTIVKFDVVVTNVGINSINVAAVPAGLAIGDYVALSEQSPIIPLPQETFPVIAIAVQNRLLEAQGDVEMLQLGEAKLKVKMEAMVSLLCPRIQDQSKVIVNRSMLRGR